MGLWMVASKALRGWPRNFSSGSADFFFHCVLRSFHNVDLGFRLFNDILRLRYF